MNKGIWLVFAGIVIVLGSLLEMKVPLADSKPTVIYFYRHSCRFCDEFEYMVLSKPEVKAELERFNFKKMDASKQNSYQVSLTPTIIILNKNNVQIKKFIPPMNKREFINILKSVDQ